MVWNSSEIEQNYLQNIAQNTIIPGAHIKSKV